MTAHTFTDPGVIAAWTDYEARSARAHRQYLLAPTALHHIGLNACHGCGRATQSKYGVCRKCQAAR